MGEADVRLVVPHQMQTGRQLIFRKAPKADALIERAVPGNVGVGGECHRVQAARARFVAYGFDQGLAQTLAAMLRHHGQLIEMQRAVEHAAGGKADGRIAVIHHDKAQILIDVGPEELG